MAVAVVRALVGSLVRRGADHRRRLGFDEGLEDELDARADQIDVSAGAERLEQRIRVKIKLGHRGDLLCRVLQGHVEIHSGGPLTWWTLGSIYTTSWDAPELDGEHSQESLRGS